MVALKKFRYGTDQERGAFTVRKKVRDPDQAQGDGRERIDGLGTAVHALPDVTLEEFRRAIEEDRKNGVEIDVRAEVHVYMARRMRRDADAKALVPTRRVVANAELETRAEKACDEAREFLQPLSCPCRQKLCLGRLSQFADWFPLDLRKRLKALAGDYDDEIVRLHREGRYRVARWNKYLAWAYAIWYVVRSPLDRISGLLVKSVSGK